MRKGKLLIFTLLVTLCAGVTSAFAQDQDMLQVNSLVATEAPQETPLSEISKVTFTTSGFDVVLSDNTSKSYTFANAKSITFKFASSGIEDVVNENGMQVNPNPVRSTLNITGYDANQEYRLAIYTITGQEILRVNDWKGESIDVSSYAAGIYLININSTTIKFIKL